MWGRASQAGTALRPARVRVLIEFLSKRFAKAPWATEAPVAEGV